MNRGVADWLRANAQSYRQIKESTGAGDYPFQTNACRRCHAKSPQPLIPTNRGWWCRVCAYPVRQDDDDFKEE